MDEITTGLKETKAILSSWMRTLGLLAVGIALGVQLFGSAELITSIWLHVGFICAIVAFMISAVASTITTFESFEDLRFDSKRTADGGRTKPDSRQLRSQKI